MRRYIIDIEGDNLFHDVTKVHCLVLRDIDSGEVLRFRHHGKGKEAITTALKLCSEAGLLVGHNILSYDIPTLRKLYPKWSTKAKLFDTLVASRLIWTNLFETDALHRRILPVFWGLHSLEAWGHRLKCLKGTFGKTNDFAAWSPAMEDYCAQDTLVTLNLYKLVLAQNYSETALDLEHQYRAVIDLQEKHGFRFDTEAASKLVSQLQQARAELTEKLQQAFPPEVETMKKPAYYFSREDRTQRWTTKGEAIKGCRTLGLPTASIEAGPLRTKEHLFNPGSRDQIARRLTERYGWKPKKFTEGGKPAIDEQVLAALKFPEARLLGDYLKVGKILGQLAEGENGCLRLARNGRIYGSVNTNGAVTGRCTHSAPNIAQTPSVVTKKGPDGKKLILKGLDGGFGFEFRDCYRPDLGHEQVGWDAAGLELRCLAHFLYPYDGGKFEKLLLEGDVHTENQKAAGFHLRDSAKTFIYAYLYGAGDEKLGKIAVDDALQAKQPRPAGSLKTIGSDLRARFENNFKALARLKADIKATLKTRSYLRGLDGRALHVRSDHAALNTLLQSAGALLMKLATVLQHKALTDTHKLTHGRDFALIASIHDELQYTVAPRYAELVGKSGPEALREAGRIFGFRCQLDGEWKRGASWAETH